MKIIVHRRYAHLINDLTKAFEQNANVNIWMDRRYDERRVNRQPVLFERRRNERRQAKEALAEVVAQE